MQTTRTPYSVSFMATVLLLLLFACHSTIANAAVALGATRVIYPANQKQVLLPVTNNDPASVYLIQSWIENAGDQKDTQFVITPPLFSMQGKKENTLRIINATNHQLPGDRESLFWVNVKAIPAMEKDQKNENTLQLAIISRIKMFYRPTHLAMAPEEAPAMLRFRRSGSITLELSTIRRGTFMKSALKKSVVSTSISLILASGMAAFAAHAADDVKLKATKTNVAFSDFTPTEYSTKGKPNIIVLTMDDLGYGQLPFDKGSFDPKTMENREVVDTYKIGIDKAIEAAQKSTPTLLSLMDEGVRFTNGYVAHGVSGPSRAAIMTGRAPARFGVYSNTDAQDGIPLTETFLPELFQNHGYYTAAVGKWHLSKISNVPVPEDKQTRDYHDNFTTFSAEEWQPQNRGFDYFMGFHAAGTAYYNSPSLFKNRERVPAKGYISDQLTDEAIGVVDRAKTLDQPFMLYLAYNAPHLPNDNPAPEQYQKQFNTGSQTADNYYASVYSVDQGVKRILEQLKKNGQYDNTIILFTSDNGAVIDGPLPLNGAQKGYKSQTYPGGTHTPMFMWWKGKLQPGNYDKLISAMDFYPTALDAADISIPKDLKLDGVSLLPWLQNKKQGEPHKNLTWITSYSHWFDEENIPFWDNYHKFVRHQSDDYPHNPNTEDLSQFSYTVRNNDYSLVYTVENNQLGLYKLTDLQQKDNLAAANPQVVKEMQGVVREFIDNSQPPLSEVNQEKFNNIKKALSEAK